MFKPHSGKANFIKALLLRIDQEIQDENVFKEYGGSISVEHALPQKATDSYWESRFSLEDHDYWLHRLGNLTLISGSKNSKASNRSFEKKKQTYDNPKKYLYITREICQYPEWNVDTLKEHHQKTIERAQEIWLI